MSTSTAAAYDVVVVGSGVAGLSASLAAHERGLRPILLEKTGRLGGITAYSWGLFWVGCNHLGLAAGYADSRDEVLEYLRFIGGGAESDERLRAFIDTSPAALRFFEGAGIPFRLCEALTDHYFDAAPGSKAAGRTLEVDFVEGAALGEWRDRIVVPDPAQYHVLPSELITWGGMNQYDTWDQELLAERRARDLRGMGYGLVSSFVKQLAGRGVEMRTGARVERLLVRDGRVAGVALAGGEEIAATRGVVLSAGGYDGDPDLAADFDGMPGQIPLGPRGPTGDLLLAAGEIGAALRHIHNSLQLFLAYQLPGTPPDDWRSAWWPSALFDLPSPHTIVVNTAGERFANESHFQHLAPKLREYDPHTRRYRHLPAFLIFDRQFARRFSFAGRQPGAEIPDWVQRASTPTELAQKLGINATALERTIQRFNGFVRAGWDDDFSRGAELWRLAKLGDSVAARLGTLEEPPYYGVELHPSTAPSVGLAADTSARVLDVRGRPIPGLYATGGTACFDEAGVGYQHGLTLASGMTFSYAAVRDMSAPPAG